jgi:DNA-binding CsgD family transcriptional regulator
LLATAARIEVRATAHGLPPRDPQMLHKAAAGLPQRTPAWRAWALQFAAEMDSMQAPSPAWTAALTAWEKTSEPQPTCYARLRAAEAAIIDHNYEQARQWLTAAADDAATLGAAPLSREAGLLATSARLNLRGPSDPASHTPSAATRLGLTQRETEVLLLLAEGLPNKAIAEKLVITEKTASVHVSRILTKLQANNRTHAVITARRQGLLASPTAT